MASLEQRNGTYRIIFRYGGQKYSRSLKTKDERAANLALAQLEDNLRRVELGTLTIPPDADVPTVLMSSGTTIRRTKAPKRYLLGTILDSYLESIPSDAIESSTHKMLRIHIGHLKRLLGCPHAAYQDDAGETPELRQRAKRGEGDSRTHGKPGNDPQRTNDAPRSLVMG